MSYRITKTIATDASDLMKEKAYQEKINEITEKINKAIEVVAKKYIPAPVIAVVNEYKTYFYTYSNVSVTMMNERGYREKYISGEIPFSIPGNCSTINVEKEDYLPLKELNDKKTDLIVKRDEFGDSVCNALLQLRTYKNVEKVLPEAIKYLPVEAGTNLPAPIYDGLNELIGKIKD